MILADYRLPLHKRPHPKAHNMTTTATNHAAANAAAWCENILDQLARLKVACRESGINEGIYETIRDEIQESPLSLQVRSNWGDLGGELEPAELCILLSTGGPALRIVGELGLYNCPQNCRMEYQDWGTPWTEYRAIGSAVLDSWAAQFYWGD